MAQCVCQGGTEVWNGTSFLVFAAFGRSAGHWRYYKTFFDAGKLLLSNFLFVLVVCLS